MRSEISEALNSARDTKALRIGVDILAELSSFFKENFPQKKAVVICDMTTYKVAGEKVFKLLQAGGLTSVSPFIFDEAKPYAEFSKIEKLENFLKSNECIPVAVGSGTINDLTKLSSSRCGRPYMCVGTAASMDGYTAYGASITFEGSKQTFSCHAPYAFFADVEIIRNAPAKMTASGYADLFAKITAGADWILADSLGVEPIDEKAWSIVQDGLKDALAKPELAKNGDVEAIVPLTEGLLLGGFAMQWAQSSRPASGAEHQFSHLWNMEHHTYNGEMPSHGFQVGVATYAVTRLYEEMLNTPLQKLDVELACNKWMTWEQKEKQIIEMFGKTDFLNTALKQSKEKYITKENLKYQLERLKNNWEEIKNRVNEQVIPSAEVKKRLEAVGAPTSPEQIGISIERMKKAFYRAQHIRSRFTVLDVAVRTGNLENWVTKIY